MALHPSTVWQAAADRASSQHSCLVFFLTNNERLCVNSWTGCVYLRAPSVKPRHVQKSASYGQMRVLCVAEKPSISKAVAGHLSGGSLQTVSTACHKFRYTDSVCAYDIRTYALQDAITVLIPSPKHNTRNKFIKNYSFDYDFGPALGQCSVTMTCVAGHLTNVDFTSEYKNWSYPPPESLFNAPIVTSIHDVSGSLKHHDGAERRS